jgi:hypothetical protein
VFWGALAPAGAEFPPEWLKAGGEYRGRVDAFDGLEFRRGAGDLYYHSRLRLRLEGEPRSWLRFQVEGQDARTPGLSMPGRLDGYSSRMDFRQAWVEVGSQREGVSLRVGRQDVILGDERLIGADNFWDPLGHVWDGARLSWRRAGWQADALAYWLVEPRYREWDLPATANRLYGIYVTAPELTRKLHVETYCLFSEMLGHEHTDGYRTNIRFATFGARAAVPDIAGFDANFEIAFERGRNHDLPMNAWIGHWEAGRKLGRGDLAPRAGTEFNYTSGDARPRDGVHRTYDDMYSSNFNKYGVADPFIWRNLQSSTYGLDWRPAARWKLSAGYRSFWLAAKADCLYAGGGETCLVRNPGASSSRVGDQVLAMAAWEYSRRWQLYFGCARLAPGPFLRESGFDTAYTTPFAALNFRF